ncbi:AraC family transcriptional regulator [Neisseria sp. Ec49-e6-T10]|uniref:AraC family transcriptional regulator n=1 Tax=Neisseria sp. Ec49-e6-T10 TaxID=3140744 RepID=UPI003EB953A8
MTQKTAQYYFSSIQMPFLELRATYHSTQSYKAHSHKTFSIGAITYGQTQLHQNNQTTLLNVGDLVLIPPDMIHSCNPLQNQARSYYMLYLDYDWCLTKTKHLYGQNTHAFYCPAPKISEPYLFTQYMALVSALKNHKLTLAEQKLDTFIHHIFKHHCAPFEQTTHTTHHFTQHIKNTFNHNLDSPPKLTELAKQFNLRQETLIRQFKKKTGISPKAYLNNLRVEQAKKLLKNGQPISDVAYQLGFCDQSHFQKIFSLYTACTPRQYQQIRSIFDNK